MSCIVWNVRGLGNQWVFRELNRLIAEKRPSLLFLCETRKRDLNDSFWAHNLGFEGCFSVESRGYSGGLCLLWKDPMKVSIKSYSQGHIDCVISQKRLVWRFTGFYGNPNTSLRHLYWSLLRRLSNMGEFSELPWLIGGTLMRFVTIAKRLKEIEDRLGNLRGFVTLSMTINYRVFTVWETCSHGCVSLDFYHSDHRPFFLTFGLSSVASSNGASPISRRFRFEAAWVREKYCEAVIVEGWVRNCGLGCRLPGRIQNCGMYLQQWARTRFRSLPKKLKTKQAQLESLRTFDNWYTEYSRIQELEEEVEILSSQEEIYWRQRSRVDWVAMGDKNTKFFHRRATMR
ncbi:uncharacterized protein [Henckelia pumila]|uniref:uncharacterized protein n=1 Tax=Henckelia pumila TaxID=405737 RepID=UPI003C6E1FF7